MPEGRQASGRLAATAIAASAARYGLENGVAVKNLDWIVLAAAVTVIVAWSARSIVIDAYMADEFVVTNSITNAKKACLATDDREACAYASTPGYTRLKAMCKETLDGVVFAQLCPVGMIEGRDLGTDQDFAARKHP
jgi:hypothetical protein